MSTTRHLVNRQRRLAAVAQTRTAPETFTPEPFAPRPSVPRPSVPEPSVPGRSGSAAVGEGARPGRRSRRLLPPLALGLATVLLGGFAAWAHGAAVDRNTVPSVHNLALTDPVRTNEVKGAVSQAVNTVFSYNYADPGRTDTAARGVLVGAAVQQYATLLAEVRAQAGPQKLVLTTTVTDSGVEMIDGTRARVLVFADQRSTSTATTATAADGTYAAAMFAVDAVRQDGAWRIASIDTFSR
ncbi:hypothetical protein [Kitasatospora sp. NBC_00315]|uniref:hypothetical protein n=1 Tax=Kitasatospora sp. NBC_00315 TaxID=2975963 RepID=UPI00324BAAFD